MTIDKKIIGGYVFILILLAIVVVAAFYSLRLTQNVYSDLIDQDQKLVTGADELNGDAKNQVAHYRGFLLYPNDQNHYLAQLDEDYRQFDAVMGEMRTHVPSSQGQSMLEEIADIQRRDSQGQQRVIALAQQGKREEGLALSVKEVQPLSNELVQKVEAFRARQLKLQSERRAEAAKTVNRSSAMIGIVSLFALISGLIISFYLSRSVTRQLQETIAQVSSSSAEILATTTQLAAGAAETATSISETTATLEEVKQTAQVSTQKGKYVSDTAQKTVQVSVAGKKSVDQSIVAMSRIKEQMSSVADSIMRLSEQSQAIGEIIATVNDLAEQSNLLAVNAAIEAAKAGEQGKGFGVVAQEVKSLAEQSKQATSQVRAILGEIQKAISGAVLATEQGSKAVESGVKQSTEAGDAIRMLAESISESAQAATQIAASSQQQLVGMDQIALAMENIKQATTQNVAGSKQAEVAAQNLHSLGTKLRQLVDHSPH